MIIASLLPLVPASVGGKLDDLFDIFVRVSTFGAFKPGKESFEIMLYSLVVNKINYAVPLIMDVLIKNCKCFQVVQKDAPCGIQGWVDKTAKKTVVLNILLV